MVVTSAYCFWLGSGLTSRFQINKAKNSMSVSIYIYIFLIMLHEFKIVEINKL